MSWKRTRYDVVSSLCQLKSTSGILKLKSTAGILTLTGPLHVQSVAHAFLELVTDCLYTGSLFVTNLFRNLSFTRVNICIALILKSVYNCTYTYKTIYRFDV